MLSKLSRKDIELLNILAQTPEGKSALDEYIEQHEKAVRAYKVYRESVVAEVEVDKVVKPVETKRKFKAGDKVRVLTTKNRLANTTLCEGEESVVAGYKEDDIAKWSARGGSSLRPVKVLDGERKKLLGDPHGYFEESALELVEEKSANEQRAEVIQRAKDFVGSESGIQVIKRENYYTGTSVEFVVNENKKTIVALMRNGSRKLMAKGIAKCHPDDVFNADISKAIALGRALGKDVSEFENAVQPTIAIGQLIEFNSFGGTEIMQVKNFHHSGSPALNEWLYTSKYKILDDTNAQYGGVE